MKVEYQAKVKAFASQMEKQLQANSHKGCWEGLELSYLWQKLWEEIEELAEELDKKVKNPSRISEEAADAANILLMFADLFGDLTAGRKSEVIIINIDITCGTCGTKTTHEVPSDRGVTVKCSREGCERTFNIGPPNPTQEHQSGRVWSGYSMKLPPRKEFSD